MILPNQRIQKRATAITKVPKNLKNKINNNNNKKN